MHLISPVNFFDYIACQAKGGDGWSQEPSVKVWMKELEICDDEHGDGITLIVWFPYLHEAN